MRSLLAPRDPFTDIKTALSSWDNCMAKAYCKWPVVAAIIIGGLIGLSVILCLARCICCGAECVCCCFRCCGGGRKSKSGHERVTSDLTPMYPTEYTAVPYAGNPQAGNPYAQAHAAAPPPPPMNPYPDDQQYRSHNVPTFDSQPNPQFATFDASAPSKPVNDDALPAMPSWKEARSVQVEVQEMAVPEKRGDMEMDRLNHNGSVTNNSIGVGGGAAMGLSAARRTPAPGASSPVSPFQDYNNHAPGYQNDSFVSVAPQRNSPDPYNRPYAQQDNYGRNVSPVYEVGDNYMQNQQTYNQPQPNPYELASSYPQPNRYDSPAPPSYATNDYAAQPRSNTPGYSQPQSQSQQQQQYPYTPTSPSEYSQATSLPQQHQHQQQQPPSRTNTPAYPGQQSYPNQQPYQAFQPIELPAQGQQYSGVTRRAVEGTYREV